MRVALTDRLLLRWIQPADAEFILALVNDEAWLRFIGDRGVRSLEDAQAYIAEGPQAMYARLGFGLFAVQLRPAGALIGLCGLLRRDTLSDVDIGYALLPQFRGHGYALEAAHAVVRLAREEFGLRRLLALANVDNAASANVLLRLGFGFEGMIELVPGSEPLSLYSRAL